MTDDEMEKIAVDISKRKIHEKVKVPCPNAAPNPGTYFGAMHAMKYLKRIGESEVQALEGKLKVCREQLQGAATRADRLKARGLIDRILNREPK